MKLSATDEAYMKPTATEILKSQNPTEFDDNYDGSCPCASIYGHGFTIQVHCWRCGHDCDCDFSGIHVDGLPNETALTLAKHIRDESAWADSTDWTLVINGQPHHKTNLRLPPATVCKSTDLIIRLMSDDMDQRAMTILQHAHDYIAADYPTLGELAGVTQYRF